jgi:hypothetical protein
MTCNRPLADGPDFHSFDNMEPPMYLMLYANVSVEEEVEVERDD